MRWGIALVALGVAATAAADVRDDDKLEADKLFQEGRALLEQGKRTDACAKFDLSFRKDPRAVGTMLNLGLCAEEAGQIATAVRYYSEARDRAHDQSLAEHQEAAERKIALLAPRVPHLSITLPRNAPDAKVIVDQIVLAPDQLRDVQVDPGERSVVVTAPGKLPFEKKLTLAEGAHQSLAVPDLQGERTIEVRPSTRRLWGKILTASGVGLAGGGLALGFYGRSLYDRQFPNSDPSAPNASDPQHHCFTIDSVRHCDPTGASRITTARRVALAGTITGIAGLAVAATGAYLWWRSPATVTVDVTADHAVTGVTVAW